MADGTIEEKLSAATARRTQSWGGDGRVAGRRARVLPTVTWKLPGRVVVNPCLTGGSLEILTPLRRPASQDFGETVADALIEAVRPVGGYDARHGASQPTAPAPASTTLAIASHAGPKPIIRGAEYPALGMSGWWPARYAARPIPEFTEPVSQPVLNRDCCVARHSPDTAYARGTDATLQQQKRLKSRSGAG